jgi:hypothetical protein
MVSPTNQHKCGSATEESVLPPKSNDKIDEHNERHLPFPPLHFPFNYRRRVAPAHPNLVGGVEEDCIGGAPVGK